MNERGKRERETDSIFIYIGKESIPGRERKREETRDECYSLVATIFLFFFFLGILFT